MEDGQAKNGHGGLVVSADFERVTFRRVPETGYHRELREAVERRGGLFNAHLHIDRSGTLAYVARHLEDQETSSVSAMSLQKKHSLITMVHESEMYRPEALSARVGALLTGMAESGTRRADTTVDVTDDGLRLHALEAFLALKEDLAPILDLRVGAYNPLGFPSGSPVSWSLLQEATRLCDFVVSLPERDDTRRYPHHIGFAESIERVLELALDAGKEVHIHVDQENHPGERGSETVVEVMEKLSIDPGDHQVWLIHAISPSSYDESRFSNLVEGLRAKRVGIIVCPSAALSMRQLRTLHGPMRNSVARVLEFSAAGLEVRLGSDNVFDITSPAGTLDLLTEAFVLAHALRFFDIEILAAFATGQRLTDEERERVIVHLERNDLEEARLIEFLGTTWEQ